LGYWAWGMGPKPQSPIPIFFIFYILNNALKIIY